MEKAITNKNQIREEKLILVGLNVTTNSEKRQILDIYESMEELKELAQAAGANVLGSIIQNRDSYDVAYYIGKGKAEEVGEYAKKMEADLVVFNEELTGIQIKNLEEKIQVPVIDRTQLILDIFATRAMSMEGKLQVELAQQKYRLSRLVGIGTQLSRQQGGIGSRGPGEKKLEVDKRHIRQRIDDIRRDLKEISKNRNTQRAQRTKSSLPMVALVGYTNSGKSTILNELIKTNKEYQQEKEVFVKDMLFATLDVQLRKATLPSNRDYLITDTVGFVSSIPHDLIEAFKATLEEVTYADLLLHVVDSSNENFRIQIETTNNVLKQLGAQDKPMLYVFNKADKVNYQLEYGQRDDVVFISALKKYNINGLLEAIEEALKEQTKKVVLLVPFSQGDVVSALHKKYNIEPEYVENGSKISVELDMQDYGRYKQYVIEEEN